MAVVLLTGGSSAPNAGLAASAPDLPGPPASGLTIPEPEELPATSSETRWAPVITAVAARRAPAADAAVVERLSTRTPEKTANIVSVLERRRDPAGRLWVHVRLATLPNGTTAWVPRSALGGYTVVTTRLVVNLDATTVTLLDGGSPIFSARVGIGEDRWPTPTGEFYIRNKLTRFSSPFYGPIAFGTSARSSVLTDWPGGGFVGIHGTSRPDILPGKVSHGCIRMRNDDVEELARLMPVGTPVSIRSA